MSTPAEQLDQQFQGRPPPLPQAPPTTNLTVAPSGIQSAYMAHTDNMRGAAASEQLDAAFPSKPVAPEAKPAPATEAPQQPATVAPGGQVDQAVQAEMQRLQQPAETVGARLDKQYGKDLPNVLRARAEENLGIKQPTVLDKAEAVGSDIGRGVVESPLAAVKGVRDAWQSTINLIGQAVKFAGQELPAPPQSILEESKARSASAGISDDQGFELPNLKDPTSNTGEVIKNAVQFAAGMRSAGGQLRELGIVSKAGWGARGLSVLKGFLGGFEAFDGPRQDLSNLVQSVPALRNPVSQLLAVQGDDSNVVRRLKSAAEGTVVGQALDWLVHGIQYLRAVNNAKAAAEHVQGLAAGNEDLGDNIGSPQPLASLGNHLEDESKPLVSANFSEAKARMQEQQLSTEGMTPEEVAKMGTPVGGAKNMVNEFYGKSGKQVIAVADDRIHFADGTSEPVPDELKQKPWEDADQLGTAGRMAANEPGAAKQMLDEFQGGKETAPVGFSGFRVNGNANVDLATDPFEPNTAHLEMIKADEPGQGQGTAALKQVTDLADKHGVTMELNAVPQPGGPSTEKLMEIYGKAGFIPNLEKGEAAMVRPPASKEPGIYVNFARINGPDDVKNAMGQLADAFKDNINQARRGVQTFEDTKLGADAVNAWDTLMSRRVGEPLNAEQSLAARQLWATSASKTYDLANAAVATPTPENLFAFRKMLATHAAIQEQVIAARTETARALSSWRIPAGAADYRMAQIMGSLKAETGPNSDGLQVALGMAQRVKALQEAGDVEGLNGFVEKSVYAKTRDAALEAWTNGLLTSPLTHVKVTVSNAATVALRIGERGIASQISGVLGDTDGVSAGEAAAQYSGLVSGLKDAFRYAGRAANAFLNEEPIPPLGNDPLSNAIKAAKSGSYTVGEDTPDHRFGGAISSDAFNMSQSGWAGQGVDYLGQLVRSPGRALTAEHDFFRSIGYRMELNALATRQAAQEVQQGSITQEAMGSRVQEIIANPPPSVTVGAIDGAKYQTFTDAPGKLANLIEQARTDFPMLRVVLPFYKIPARILSFTFERSPIAPLMSSYQSSIAAGGARASLARAQMGLGTSIMLATADAVMSGQITGSGPPDKATRSAMENTGWLPYSMKVGDHWVQYNKLETAGSSMAMAADIVETARNYHAAVNGDNPDMEKLAVAGALSIAQNITSKTYLQGLSNMFDAIANPKTEGESVARSYAGSLVPAGVGAIDRMQDPYQRTVYSMMDAIKAKTPGWSETLPPRRDEWGQPVEHASDLGKAYDLLSPFATRKPNDSPIDKEVARQGFNVNLPESKASFGGGAVIDLRKDPALYSRYVELAGNGYKDPAWGLGAKDLLDQIVSGNHPLSSTYNMKSDGPQGGKAQMVQGLMNQYREGARQQLLQENPKLQTEVEQMRQNVNALKMPQ